MKTRSVVLEGPRKMAIREFDIPAIGPDEGLLKVVMAGVCGSDPKGYQTGANAPLIRGHEIVGEIAEIGAAAAKRYGVKTGDRVAVEPGVRCGYCDNCLIGNFKFCTNRRSYGVFTNALVPPHIWGAFGEYMYLAPNSIVYKMPADMTWEAAVLINAVIANGIQWVRIRGGASIGNAVVIQGSGPQGLSAVIAARESGAAPIIITGMLPEDQERFGLAREFGADYTVDIRASDVVEKVKELTRGKMADVVLDVTGHPEGILKSIDLVKRGGTLVCGSLTGGKVTPIPTDKLAHNEIRFQGVFTSGGEAGVAAIKLVERKKYPLEKMVTHRYPLEKTEEAIQAVGREIPGVYPIKAVVIPDMKTS